ncbi:MAG: CHASE3 domain-containing protein [Chitinophagaceae bacterium]
MNLKAFSASFKSLKIIFIISLLLIILISALSYKQFNTLSKSVGLVVHAHKIQIELEQLISYLKDAETGQRGYLLTNDSVFLEPFLTARAKVNESFNTLKTLLLDRTEQQPTLDTLYNLINTRFTILTSTLRLNPHDNADLLQRRKNLLFGKDVMNSIRVHITKMNVTENNRLVESQKKYKNENYLTPIFSLLISLFSIVVFIGAYLKINKDLLALKKANEKLIIDAAATKHAEEIGNFSSWQWNLETNLLTYSDNQYKLLGCPPNSFEPTIDNYLQFVHPDDKHIIVEGGKEVMDERGYPTAFFRIIRKDGALRYIHSVSRILTDDNGKKILIGVNRDVTEQHFNTIKLNEINRELHESNDELSSFNHVVSHDLQEPLRKIETFISRLKEDEMQHMSEISKKYFEKIDSSAHRMRHLINDLLLFSSANKGEKIFTDTDLNTVLKTVLQELSQTIEEKKAEVHSAHLPTLAVVPFQIQQLFTNLISNSLKYSKPTISPIITIECSLSSDEEKLLFQAENTKQYFKISFTDNGLGFEQQYAENIFMPFKRLHSTSAYPGTGIGLSICKKIIENHSGFIDAEGNLGIGAKFTFFLPFQ